MTHPRTTPMTGSRRQRTTIGVIAVGAAFAALLSAGAEARAETYCPPGENGALCAETNQASVPGKQLLKNVTVSLNPIQAEEYYTNPSWQDGWNMCQKETQGATRSIHWTRKAWYNTGDILVMWDCYSTP